MSARMYVADGYSSDYVAEIDGLLNSQPPPPLPLSQLGSQTALPGLNRVFPGAPHNHLSQGGQIQLGVLPPAPTATGVGGLAEVPLPPLRTSLTQAPVASSRLPSVNYHKSDGRYGLGGTTAVAAPDRHGNGAPVAFVGAAPAGPSRGANATAGDRSPPQPGPLSGLADVRWPRAPLVPLLSQAATPFLPPSLGSPSGGSPVLSSSVGLPSCTPLTLAAGSDAVVADVESAFVSALASGAAAPSSTAYEDPTSLPSTGPVPRPSTDV